ncbi:MAG: dienelactone hydrolase family protein [Verrucomicrobiae bacterium]|nr:dienelactone hydrolase family protein [Verrucomicrobiae bacterium]
MTFRNYALTLVLPVTILFGRPEIVVGDESAAPPTAETSAKPGPYAVATRLVDWFDESRDRKVPAKIYYPESGEGPFPVIVFSHGLGGSREGYGYLGRHWASQGYVSVHPQHLGSDDTAWRGVALRDVMATMQKAANVENFIARPKDVSFVIDQLEKLNAAEDDPLAGNLDLKRVGMAGHSFGARTTMAIAGEIYALPGGREISFGDARVKAAIAMSPMPSQIVAQQEIAYQRITIPTMHLTGTLDTSPIEKGRTAAERLVPYEKTPGEHHYLINFQGGDHMIFSGRPRGLRDILGDPSKDAAFQSLILQATTAFWDAWLKDSAESRAWLTAESGGLKERLGDEADYRWK